MFLQYEKAMLDTDQKCSYTATRVNIALYFGTLKLLELEKDSSLQEKCDCVNTQQYSQ